MRLPTTTPDQFIDVSVYHSPHTKSYILSTRPVTVRDGIATYLVFSGRNIEIEKAPRFNARRLAHLREGLATLPEYRMAVDSVLYASKLTLAEEVAV